ncbi:MAG: hypothetical protein BWX66_01660 [Deltaproteobacteria bacterium ADurb.Bin058]|nr:MAG: hypothetical protein BWX66_01660 [Deltaproteobacteria bacterium ADurb.Bin058]
MPSEPVITSLVMQADTGWFMLVSNCRSLEVRIPTNLPSLTTGRPEMPCRRIASTASPRRKSGPTVTGSSIILLSDFLTRSTSRAWASMDRFLWITPIPPCLAMEIAALASVTVSIAALTKGIRKLTLRVKRVSRRTSFGKTVLCWGTNKMSSKVKAGSGSNHRIVMSPVGFGRGRMCWCPGDVFVIE